MVWWVCTAWFITSLFGVLYLKTFEASWQGLDSEKNGVDFVESAVDYGDRRLRERDWRAAKVTGLNAWCKACALQISEHAQSLFILIHELLSFNWKGWCKRRTLITSRKGPLQVLTTGHFGILREFSGIFGALCVLEMKESATRRYTTNNCDRFEILAFGQERSHVRFSGDRRIQERGYGYH